MTVPCACGNRGCLETISSASGVRRRTLEFLQKGTPSILSSYLANPHELSAKIIAQAARQGDELAKAIFIETGRYLGRAIINIMYLIGLEAFLIGGGASEAWDLFYPHLIEEIKTRSSLLPLEQYHIIRAKLGDDAGILGAAKAAFDISDIA